MSTVNIAGQFISPWAQLIETAIRYDLNPKDPGGHELTNADYAFAVAGTVSAMSYLPRNNRPLTIEKPSSVIQQDQIDRLRNMGLRIGADLLIGGYFMANEPDARANFIARSVGQEVGQYIGHLYANGLQGMFGQLENSVYGYGKSSAPTRTTSSLSASAGARLAYSSYGTSGMGAATGAWAANITPEELEAAQWADLEAAQREAEWHDYFEDEAEMRDQQAMGGFAIPVDQLSIASPAEMAYRAERSVAAQQAAYAQAMAAERAALMAQVRQAWNVGAGYRPASTIVDDANAGILPANMDPALIGPLTQAGIIDPGARTQGAIDAEAIAQAAMAKRLATPTDDFYDMNGNLIDPFGLVKLVYPNHGEERMTLANIKKHIGYGVGDSIMGTISLVGGAYRMATDWDYASDTVLPMARKLWNSPGVILDGLTDMANTALNGSWQARSRLAGSFLGDSITDTLTGGVGVIAGRATLGALKYTARAIKAMPSLTEIKQMAKEVALSPAYMMLGAGGGGGFSNSRFSWNVKDNFYTGDDLTPIDSYANPMTGVPLRLKASRMENAMLGDSIVRNDADPFVSGQRSHRAREDAVDRMTKQMGDYFTTPQGLKDIAKIFGMGDKKPDPKIVMKLFSRDKNELHVPEVLENRGAYGFLTTLADLEPGGTASPFEPFVKGFDESDTVFGFTEDVKRSSIAARESARGLLEDYSHQNTSWVYTVRVPKSNTEILSRDILGVRQVEQNGRFTGRFFPNPNFVRGLPSGGGGGRIPDNGPRIFLASGSPDGMPDVFRPSRAEQMVTQGPEGLEMFANNGSSGGGVGPKYVNIKKDVGLMSREAFYNDRYQSFDVNGWKSLDNGQIYNPIAPENIYKIQSQNAHKQVNILSMDIPLPVGRFENGKLKYQALSSKTWVSPRFERTGANFNLRLGEVTGQTLFQRNLRMRGVGSTPYYTAPGEQFSWGGVSDAVTTFPHKFDPLFYESYKKRAIVYGGLDYKTPVWKTKRGDIGGALNMSLHSSYERLHEHGIRLGQGIRFTQRLEASALKLHTDFTTNPFKLGRNPDGSYGRFGSMTATVGFDASIFTLGYHIGAGAHWTNGALQVWGEFGTSFGPGIRTSFSSSYKPSLPIMKATGIAALAYHMATIGSIRPMSGPRGLFPW